MSIGHSLEESSPRRFKLFYVCALLAVYLNLLAELVHTDLSDFMRALTLQCLISRENISSRFKPLSRAFSAALYYKFAIRDLDFLLISYNVFFCFVDFNDCLSNFLIGNFQNNAKKALGR